MRYERLLGGTLVAALAASSIAASGQTASERNEFFEKRVRPVLAQRCYSCHSAQQQIAGIRLDSPVFIAGSSAKNHKIVLPGDPSKSALIQTIRYDGAIRMPPVGKIPQAEIDALTKWVAQGANWPVENARASNALANRSALDQASKLWSLQPVSKPEIPAVRQKAWVKNPIDSFILSSLEAKGLTPNPPADRRTLLRRVSYDLIGLPPTPAETSDFEKDASSNAYEKAVDRLLASPHYGERWGRYWLDIARYADTKGGPQFGFPGEESRYPFAHVYRDWVIQALNDDMPYDRFLTYQIAADRMNLEGSRKHLAALGFLTLGRRNANDQQDLIDDRIDVVMRGTQGLTVSCARCHDHKFDPIPTADYYSLSGVFSGSAEKTVMLASNSNPDEEARVRRFEVDRGVREGKISQFLEAKRLEQMEHTRTHLADYLLAAEDPLERQGGGDETISGLKIQLIAQWKQFLTSNRNSANPILIPWSAYFSLPPSQWQAKSPSLAAKFANDGKLNPLISKLFAVSPPATRTELARRYAGVLASVESHWRKALKSAAQGGSSPPSSLPDRNEEQVRQLLYGNGLIEVDPGQVETLLKEADRNRLVALRLNVQRLMESPSSPSHALVLEDIPGIPNPRILLRGDLATPGEEVPRRFLLAVAGEKRQPFVDGSGRLELAKAIANSSNPLTGRVMANRVWLGHFGQGIVRTPSDFGTRGEAPSHPELLDWLASKLAEGGEGGRNPWSLKALHKLILLSNAYQQSDEDNPEARKADPENRLFWRMNRRRLDFEQMRDTLLVAGGEIDKTIGGSSVEITRAPFSRRRTLYALVDRSNLPAMYRVFDFANPDAHVASRYVTTSPQQSLFLLNSPFVIAQAKRFAATESFAQATDIRRKIREIYLELFGREPSGHEIEVGEKFLSSAIVRENDVRTRKPSPWLYGFGEYDPVTKRVKSFTPLPYWSGEVWQSGLFLPDPDAGSLSLSASGGAPGVDLRHAAIRRWVAPKGGFISIAGTLRHLSINGDGIRGRIVSSRVGEVGSWNVKYMGQETNVTDIAVQKGDTIDFVTDCLKDDTEDAFSWDPILTLTSSPAVNRTGQAGKFREAGVRWSSVADFNGPPEEAIRPLTPLEKYAQTLLLSNELAFVD